MSSSSSSGYSDEDAETSAPSAPAAPSASQLGQILELAQICSFCTTFRVPLRLPTFSRTELQEAILNASNGDRTHVELLAELHFKLAREHPTAKMEKMVQDWEKTLARKLQDNWRKEFTANPMGGRVTYADLAVLERVKILEALCNWKLDTCAEIHKHIATLQKENDVEGIKRLRAGEIGTDDKGVSYWYFDDECWIYAEDKPQWQLEERKPSYMVEFANAKRIRLSINFDPDHNSSAPPLRLAVKSVAFADEIKEEKKLKKEETVVQRLIKAKVEVDGDSSDLIKPEMEQVKAEVEKREKVETSLSSVTKESHGSTVETVAVVKKESSVVVETATVEKMNINALCASESPSREDQSLQSNGSVEKQAGESASNMATADVSMTTSQIASPVEVQIVKDASPTSGGTGSTGKANEDASGDHSHATVVTIVGSKKRTIIDDDSSDSDAEFPKLNSHSSMEHLASSSPPPRKKRKASIENTTSAAELDIKSNNDDLTKSISVKVDKETTVLSSESETVTTNAKDEKSLVCESESMVVQEVISPPKNARVEAANTTEPSISSAPEENTQATTTNEEDSTFDASTTDNGAGAVKTSGPDSKSPTDPTAAPESFDITCESCKKCYDMRYVDPPLVERPTDEWRCFECLVNDARGWPRRRKSTPREPFSPRTDESSTRRRSSSSKSRSGSSSSKKSKKSSSKSRSSSSSKKKSSHSSSSKRKSSSSSSKKSSSSSSKKHKKRKSSSSSHHNSSHGHHRRRHHSHYHHAEFAKLVTLLRERKEQRLGVEEARIKGSLQTVYDEGPQGWRVVSSTLDDLRALIEALSGGSLEQDRLRGRLIVIMKDHEKLVEQRRKQQELAWNILPRRQSSRIAIGRMKNQSAHDSGAEDIDSDDDVESRRPGLRSRRSHSNGADGADDNQKHDRAWRARRRHQLSDDEMDLDNEEEEVDSNGVAVPTPGNWIDWSLLKGNDRRLSTVCLALINRLLKEESADLFSRPVDPEHDGCLNYLSVIAHPMDLGTIRSRVEASFYRKWELFKKDVELVWQNCRAYNAPDTLVVQFAGLLSKLSRSMYNAAEKKGVDRMRDKSGSDDSDNDSDNILSDASKAESRSSVNKAWTESSGSDSSDSSDGNSSSDDSDSDLRSRKRTSTRTPSKKPQTRSRSTRPSRTTSPAKSRSSRNTRSRSSRKRSAPTSSSGESSAFENEAISPRKSRQPARGASSKVDEKADPPTEDADSSDNDANNRPPPPQNGTPSSSPPPPPPPQAAQKRSKPRLIISDSSSSDDSSDSNSSSASSSDSDDSDSDAAPVNKPPPPSTVEAPAPPPPSPPPPAASPDDKKPPARSPDQKAKTTAAGKKTKTSKTGASSSYTPLLNSYLSPSSSSSSDFSSGDSDSSDSDSD